MVGHGGSSASSYLADPTSPIPFHCASIVVTSTLKGRIVQATVCCKVGAAALVHLRPVLGGCTILPFKS